MSREFVLSAFYVVASSSFLYYSYNHFVMFCYFLIRADTSAKITIQFPKVGTPKTVPVIVSK